MAETVNESLDSHLDFLLRDFNENDEGVNVVPCSQCSTYKSEGDEASMILCSQQNKEFNPWTKTSNHEEKLEKSTFHGELFGDDFSNLGLYKCNSNFVEKNRKKDLMKRLIKVDSVELFSFKRKKTECCSQPVTCPSGVNDKEEDLLNSSWPGYKQSKATKSNCLRNRLEQIENMQFSNISDSLLCKNQLKVPRVSDDQPGVFITIDARNKTCNTLALHDSEIQSNKNHETVAYTYDDECAFDSSHISLATNHICSHPISTSSGHSSTIPFTLPGHVDSPRKSEWKMNIITETQCKDLHVKHEQNSVLGSESDIFDTQLELFKTQATKKSLNTLPNVQTHQEIHHLETELPSFQKQSELINCHIHLELPTIHETAENVQKGTELSSNREQEKTQTNHRVSEPSKSNNESLPKSPSINWHLESSFSEEQVELSKIEQTFSIAQKISESPNVERHLEWPEIHKQLRQPIIQHSIKDQTVQSQPDSPNGQEYLELSDTRIQERSLSLIIQEQRKSPNIQKQHQPLPPALHSCSTDQKDDTDHSLFMQQEQIIKQLQYTTEGENCGHHVIGTQERENVTSVILNHSASKIQLMKNSPGSQKLLEPMINDQQQLHAPIFQEQIGQVNVFEKLEALMSKQQQSSVEPKDFQREFDSLNDQEERETLKNDSQRGVELITNDTQTEHVCKRRPVKEEVSSEIQNVLHDSQPGLVPSNTQMLMETMPSSKVEAKSLKNQEQCVPIHETKGQEIQEMNTHYNESVIARTFILKNAENVNSSVLSLRNYKSVDGICEHVSLESCQQEKAKRSPKTFKCLQTREQVHHILNSVNECQKASDLLVQKMPSDNGSFDLQEPKHFQSNETAEGPMVENMQVALSLHEHDLQTSNCSYKRCKDSTPDNLSKVSVLATLKTTDNDTTTPDLHAVQEVPVSNNRPGIQIVTIEPHQSTFTQPKNPLREPCNVDVELYACSRERNGFSLLQQSHSSEDITVKLTQPLPPALNNCSKDQKDDTDHSLFMQHEKTIKQVQCTIERENFGHQVIETQERENVTSVISNYSEPKIQLIKKPLATELPRKEFQNKNILEEQNKYLSSSVTELPINNSICNKAMPQQLGREKLKHEAVLTLTDEDIPQFDGGEGKEVHNIVVSPQGKTIERAEHNIFSDNGQPEDHKVPENHISATDEWKEISLYGRALRDNQDHPETGGKRVFQWHDVYEATLLKSSNITQLENHPAPELGFLQPPRQTQRPLRVGLSRKQKVKSLHDK